MDYNSSALGGLAVRWLHLTASVLLVGALSALLLAGRSARPTARAWELRVVAAARLLLAAVFGSGLAALAWQ
ncbi:MAG: hypothetical protein HY614_01295, partial [Candidatus Rokubacteria bacterium]|nr:hypothetical protein [Candidatus Rokubacteria bacterium]